MRIPIPEQHVGLPILILWIGVVILLVAAFFLFQWWRARHPKAKHRDVSYSKALESRMSGRHSHKTVRRKDKDESRKVPGR